MSKTTLKYKLTFLLICASFLTINAQYTNVINSNKPGLSESPYGVGSGVYQFENSIFYKDTSIKFGNQPSQSVGFDLLFRTSFFLEKLEINTQLSYQRDKIFKGINTNHYFKNNLSKATIGAKYLVFQKEFDDKSIEVRSWRKRNAFDKKRLIPSVAIYAGLNTNFLGEVHKTNKVSPKLGVLLQNDLSKNFNIITNLYYDKIGTLDEEFSYIITGTFSLNQRWSSFFENQSAYKKERTDTNIGVGLAYLFTRDLQINTSARGIFEGETDGFYLSIGASYRIDNHRDPFTELDDNGNPLEETVIEKLNRKKSRFFNRILNLFKKNKKIEGINIKKKKRGRFFGIFKKRKKKESEVQKLEREIKELEKEIKKDDN